MDVVQLMLLFVSEMWEVTLRMSNNLGGFHHRLAKKITGKLSRKRANSSCHYHLLADVMIMAGLEELEIYIARRQNMVSQYIDNMPILGLFLEVEKHPGSRVAKRWW